MSAKILSVINVHMWCCIAHQTENEESLQKFQDEIRTKFNLEFCFIAMQTLKSGNSIPKGSAVVENFINKAD